MRYETARAFAQAELIEKKSRFIAQVFPAASEEEVRQILEGVRKKHWEARHHCWACLLGYPDSQARSSDDGEPSQTAGKPILEALQGSGLADVLVVVTRYFGGVLLGTGGLVRAYAGAAKEALAKTPRAMCVYGREVVLSLEYGRLGKVEYLLEKRQVPVREIRYAAQVEILLSVEEEDIPSLRQALTECTGGNIGFRQGEAGWFTL